jgi:DNA-binding beta-propeller fold protein YncE
MRREISMMLRWIAILLCTVSAAVAQTGTLVVVNQKQHAVDLVDPVSGKLMAAVSVGVNGHEIALSKDTRTAYVPIYSNTGVGKPGTNGHEIDVIDLPQAKVLKIIDLGHAVRPHKVLMAPNGLLYVTAELDHAIDIVDPVKGVVVGQIPTGAETSHMLAVSRDWRRGYTANVWAGSVSVLDMPGRKLIKIIPLTKRVQRIVLSNDGRWVFTSDWDRPRVAVIDTKTDALKQWIPVSGVPYVTQPTPDGKWLVVSGTKADGKGFLDVVDLKTLSVVRTIPTDAQVASFLVHDGLLYGSCFKTGPIEVLDIHSPNPQRWTMGKPIVLAPGVDGMAWTMAKLDLGK